jgi:hypothetical protein
MYSFGKNIFYKKANGWEEHVENTIFYYKELYSDNDVSVFEDTGRKMQLKLQHINPQDCTIELSNSDGPFTVLYKNGRYSDKQCPKVYDIKKFTHTPSITRGKKQIAIVALATPNMKAMTDISFKNHKHYALKHDYNYLCYYDSLVDIRYVTWNKVFVIQDLLKSFKYVMWIDADAIFTNMNVTLESIIERNANKHLWVCDDIGGWRLNTGVMIWENNAWSHKVLEEWASMEKIPHNQGAEQQQLINYLAKHDDACKHWHVYNRHLFNTHPKEHKDGDFILHMMGLSGEERIKTFSEWNHKLKVS